MQDKIKEVYVKQEQISKITEKLNNFSFDDIVKTDHFYYSLDEKRIDISILKENFKNFEKVKLINKREHKNKEISYDIYYDLGNKNYLVYCIAFKKVPVLLNGFHVKRDFNKFKEHFMKKYKFNDN